MSALVTSIIMDRVLGGDGGGHDESHGSAEDDHHSGFGVHITYEDLYASIVFFAAIYLSGAFFSRFLLMPALVGEIVAGIILGPNLLNFVPNAEAFVMLGEIGLILLVLEAGIDIDLTTLKLVGVRGVIIAIVGSILPIGLGVGVAFAIGTDVKGAIASGCAFGPTSLGIAMNILRTAKIINTPVGQMIVAAAVIDDMIALVILSQLGALTGEFSVVGTIVPIVSALGFLIIGGFIAIMILPGLLDKFLLSRTPQEFHGAISLAVMFGLLFALMPTTYYAKASFLMGAFIAGLAFCSNHEAHVVFVSQFKRIMQWLIRIFFAASIGFQVPVKQFGSGTVLWQGVLFTVALLGKLATGLLVPNFSTSKRFTGIHLRDCLVVGFSMAAEGEFAFVIAVFAVDSGLISVDLYAAIVLAVLLSTILAPFLLRFTIARFKKHTEKQLVHAHQLDEGDLEEQIVQGIKDKTTIFLCIQTQSDSSWGLLPKIMRAMFQLKLEVIDHRSWHPHGQDTAFVNECYAQDNICAGKDEDAEQVLQKRMEEVRAEILAAINQADARVKVKQWHPGVAKEIANEKSEGTAPNTPRRRIDRKVSVSQMIVTEAIKELDEKQKDATPAIPGTPGKSVVVPAQEVPRDDKVRIQPCGGRRNLRPQRTNSSGVQRMTRTNSSGVQRMTRLQRTNSSGVQRRNRYKTRSTPIQGGDLFGSANNSDEWNGVTYPGTSQPAQVIINGETFMVNLDARAIDKIIKEVEKHEMNRQVLIGASDINSIPISEESMDKEFVLGQLEGFVRSGE